MHSQVKIYKYYTSLLLLLLISSHVTISGIAPKPDSAAVNRDQWLVVIDAGHGGKDPGSLGKRSREKDIALAIALKTGAYISELLDGVKVVYTRDNDTFVELYRRAEIANRAKADLFISIHCNGVSDRRIRGSETFAMGVNKDRSNLEVAMAENSVITLEDDYTTRYEGYDPNSSESFITFSLMQNIYLEQSLYFASFVQDQFRERVGLRDRGVKQAEFLVLWRTTMPSVLVEAGFISNQQEESFLMSSKGQDYVASAIFRAFREYKTAIDEKSDFSTVKADNVKTARHADDLTDKIDFRIQISSSLNRKELKPELFNKLENLSEIKAGKYYKYTSGHLPSYEEAVTYRKYVQSIYPDAFVIAVKNNTILPLHEAIEESKNR